MSLTGMGQAFAAGVQGFNQGYDYSERSRNDREDRALRMKKEAEDRKNTLEKTQYENRMAKVKADSMDELYGQATGKSETDATINELKQQIKELKDATNKQAGIDINKQIISQVIAPDSRENLSTFNGYKKLNPIMTKLFGEEDVRMPSKDSYEDRQSMYATIAQQGGVPSPELADRMMDSGLYYVGPKGRMVDSTNLMAAMGTLKIATPEQKKAYEDLMQQTYSPKEKALELRADASTSKEVSGSTEESQVMVDSIKAAQAEDNTVDTKVRQAESEAKLKAAEATPDVGSISQVQLAEPTKADKVLQTALDKPKVQDTELLRALAGIRAEPTGKAKTAMEVTIDMATKLTGSPTDYDSEEEYSKELIKNIQALKFNPNTGKGGVGGDTASIKTLKTYAEIADNIDGKYSPTEVQMAKNYIQAHNPGKPTDTMRNIQYKDQFETGQASSALAGGTGSYTGAGTPMDIKNLGVPSGGKPGTSPLVGPGGKKVANAQQAEKVLPSGLTERQVAEQVTYEKGIDKATLKAVKEDAVDMPKRAQGMKRLKEFQSKINNLYKGGKMDAGYLDDFFQYIGERVPVKNGTIDQTLANAKIKDYIVKAVQEASGKTASNQEAQRQIDIIQGGAGLQEEQRRGLFNQFVSNLDSDYKDLHTRLKDSKQYDALVKADKYYPTQTGIKVGQKIRNKKDGKMYVKLPNGKFKLAE